MRQKVQKVQKFFVGGQQFKKEFRRQIRLLVIITLAFTIAFAWRQTVFDAAQNLITRFINVTGATTASILTSLFISIVAVIIIYLAAHFLKDRPDY
tara:strand:+ start:347 stop:634 length:288 start_codon:yes stop_codon:yes gene_type:complete